MSNVVAFALQGLPPSLWNCYQTTAKGRKSLTDRARNWKELAAWEVKAAMRQGETFGGPVEVEIVFTLSDRRRWDIDNHLKALFDACTEGGLWRDDSQVKRLRASVVQGTQDATSITVTPIGRDPR